VRHPAVTEGRIDTGYLDRHLDEFLPATPTPEPSAVFAAATAVLLDEEMRATESGRRSDDAHSPWARADGWRLGHPGKRIVCFARGGERIEVDAHGTHGNYVLECGAKRCSVTNAQLADGVLSASLDGVSIRRAARVDATSVLLHDGVERALLERVGAFAFTPSAQKTGDRIVAPMPGRIVLVKARVGDAVVAGQELLVMEAMKMELSLKAPQAATVAAIQANAGDFVEADTILVRFSEAT